MRMRHYGANEGLRAHTDLQLFAMIVTDGPGLEVRHADGSSAASTGGDDEIVCLLGESLRRLTNDHLRAAVHRVKWTRAKPRTSLIWNPVAFPDAMLACLLGSADDSRPRK